MKITEGQLRKIIREEVKRNLSEARFAVGDQVVVKGTGSGTWEILDLFPDSRGKMVAKLKMFQPVGGPSPTAYETTDKLQIQRVRT